MSLVKMMEQKMLSVIIPVYNKCDYLESCIESVLNQTYTDIEVILIDDGSTDGSDAICRMFEKDARVKLISQNNQGVASARKNAIKNASGKYVVFIDADDYVEKDYFEKLLNEADETDIVTSGYFKDEDIESPVFDMIDAGLYDTKEQMDYIIDNMIIMGCGFERGITSYIWNKLFRANLAKEISQEVNTSVFIGEDSEFLYRYLLKCSSIKISRICGYHYCSREKSLVNRKHDNYLINLNEIYLSLKKVFECHKRSDSLMRQLQIWTSMGIRNATYVMDFQEIAKWPLRYMFPLYDFVEGKRIVLYGAGNVGKDYYIQLRNWGNIDIVGWTDGALDRYKNSGYPLVSLDEIYGTDYDYIVIAVDSKPVSMEITEGLLHKGILRKKLIWKKPIRIEL